MQAVYIPVRSATGRVERVVKLAQDTTHRKKRDVDRESQLKAIGQSQAVIEFDLDGIICEVNSLFLDALGCQPEEVIGQHHRHFYAAGRRQKARVCAVLEGAKHREIPRR
ncbi:MAG: PAS domain S-box protein [Burkholderiaceae bacterium]|nr:PAS domain S-box protein [Burkholderiaceae bacterium]